MLFFSSLSLLLFVFFGCSDGMEREACVCDHGFERSDLCAEIIIIRVGKESARTTVPVLHRPAKGIRLSRPHTTLAGARSLRNTTADDRSDPPIPRWDESMRAKR